MLHESSIIGLVPAVSSDFTARKLLSEGLVLSRLMKSRERIQNQCFDTAQPRLSVAIIRKRPKCVSRIARIDLKRVIL